MTPFCAATPECHACLPLSDTEMTSGNVPIVRS